MKPLPIFCFLIFFSSQIFCQQPKYANTLLWRISGKGLTKPSYLYGTIHLTDKKVFFLGDSVYSAIDRSEGFAAELDLNSIGVEMMNQFMREEQEKKATEPVKLKDVVSAEIWERYKPLLAEKFEKKAENITLEELEENTSALENEIFRNGEMATFLDAHLFGIAKKKGKWVGGIEEIADQVEHINNYKNIEEKIQTALYDEDYYRHSLDWLISMYIGQKLDSIDASMYREESGQKDYIMIKRNLKMARRMDSISVIRSTFFAVGAAHLPGDSGVISMLRARGFEVSPVISSKKIDPSKYVLKSNKETWWPVEIKDSAYFLSMPGVASRFELLESYGLNTKLFFDISFMKLYMTMTIELGEDRKKLGADSLFNGFKKQYAQKGADVKEKIISVNGEEGRELRFTTPEGTFKVQIFLPGLERLVLNAIMAFKEQSLVDDESKNFFQSFVVNTNSKKTIKEETKWYSYTNQTESFTIDFPSQPVENKDVRSEEGQIIHSFQAMDLRSQIFYGMRISSLKEGLYLPLKDSTHFLSLRNDIRVRFENSHIIDSSMLTFYNFPACKITATATSEGAEVVLEILSVLRGNRNYYLFTLYQPGETSKINAAKYLNSFKLLPISYPAWTIQYSKEKKFSTSSPFSFKPYSSDEREESYTNSQRVIVYDSLASHTIFVDRTVIPSWYWYSSDTALLRVWVNKYLQYTDDSLVGYTIKNNDNSKVAEFLIVRPGQTTVKKVKLILYGNEIYEVFGTLAQQDIDKAYYKFYDDFKILNDPIPLDINRPKFKELSQAIQAGNKKEIGEIKGWWDVIDFAQADLAGLQSLMFKVYPDLDSIYHSSINWKIIQKIQQLDTNNFTIDFIKNNYKSIAAENNRIKPLLVSYLAGISTKESFSLIRQIVGDESYPVGINMYYYLSLYDSLRLTATLYPEILKLAGSENLASQIFRVTTTLLDSNLLTKSMIKTYEKYFISGAKKGIKEKSKDDEVYEYYDLARILGMLNTPESNKMLVEFSKYSDREMRYISLIEMLKNNLPVDSRTVYTLASTDEYRYNLYEELRKLNKQTLFPRDYLSQEKLASSKLITDHNDEEYPITIKLVGTKTILYKGKQQKVYLYRVFQSSDYEDSPATSDIKYYLGVAGPFSINGKDYNSNHEMTGIYWEKELDINKLDALLNEYLKSLKE